MGVVALRSLQSSMSRILIADDNPHARRMGSEILTEEGHEIVLAASGEEVLDLLAAQPPDLVIVDRKLPGRSGLEIREHIKSRPELAHVKVVLLAGAMEAPSDVEADSARSDGVLHKPLDPATVIQTVQALLSNGSAGPAAAEFSSAASPEPSGAPESATAAVFEGDPAAPGPSAIPEESEPPSGEESVSAAVSPSGHSSNGGGTEEQTVDEFALVVEQAMRHRGESAARKERVRAVVTEVLEAAVPAIIERVTERVMETLREE